MNCHRVQSLLSAYLDQEISPEERRLIRNHIFNCPVCAKSFEELSSVKNYLGNLEPPPPQIDLIDQLLYCNFHADHSFTASPLVWGKRLSLTAACIFLFLLTSFYLFPVSNNNRKMAGPEGALRSAESSFTYQLVNEQSNSINLFVEEDEEEENKKKEIEKIHFPNHNSLLPGIPVSR